MELLQENTDRNIICHRHQCSTEDKSLETSNRYFHLSGPSHLSPPSFNVISHSFASQFNPRAWNEMGRDQGIVVPKYYPEVLDRPVRDLKLWQPLESPPLPRFEQQNASLTCFSIPVLLFNHKQSSGPLDLRVKKPVQVTQADDGVAEGKSSSLLEICEVSPLLKTPFNQSVNQNLQNSHTKDSCNSLTNEDSFPSSAFLSQKRNVFQDDHCTRPLNLSHTLISQWTAERSSFRDRLNSSESKKSTIDTSIKQHSDIPTIASGTPPPGVTISEDVQQESLPHGKDTFVLLQDPSCQPFTAQVCSFSSSSSSSVHPCSRSPTRFNENVYEPHVSRCPHEDCGRIFHSRGALTIHVHRFHTSRTPQQQALRIVNTAKKCHQNHNQQQPSRSKHRRISTSHKPGEKSLACTFAGCDKSFREMKHLKVHQMQHTDDRPLACQLCSYSCRQRNSMNWHMKAKHGHDKKVTQDGKTIYLKKESTDIGIVSKI